MRTRWLAALAIVGVLGACGGDDAADTTDAPADVTEAPGATDSTAAASDSSDAADSTEPPTTDETSAPETDATSAPTTEPAADASGDRGCHVDVTGGLEVSWDSPDDNAAITTDYWYSEEELLQQIEFLAEEGTDPATELANALETGEPIFSLLLMNCSEPDGGSLSFTHSSATTRSAMPMAAGSYPISGGFLSGADSPSGTISVLVVMPGEAEADAIWVPEGEGTFEITSWDNAAIEGTFTFPVAESLVDAPRQATVNGTFAYTCKASTTCG